MPWSLHVVVGSRDIGTFEVRSDRDVVIGRDSGSDIVIPDRSVSRQHCHARRVPDGIELEDLDSANGLYTGGDTHQSVVLKEGEVCNLGMARVSVKRTRTNHTGMIPISGLLDSLAADSSGIDIGGLGSDVDAAFPPDQPPSGVLRRPGGTKTSNVASGGHKSSSDSFASASSIGSQRSKYDALEKDRLAILIETSKSLGQSTDLDQLLSRIMDHLFEILPVKRAVIALTDDGENFSARAVRPQLEDDALEEGMSAFASQAILKKVVAAQKGEIIKDAMGDQKLNANQSIIMTNIRAAICVPILANNRALGAIYADFPGKARLYTENDLSFLTAFASISAVSLENARMVRQLRDDEKLKRDLEIAAEIQQGILPDEVFDFPGIELDWAYWPSRLVGGDFYDVLELDDGKIVVVLGDVSGKSIPAAIYMARTISVMRAVIQAGNSAGDVLSKTNGLLSDSGERQLFATAFVMIIDPTNRKVEWSNAGHNPVLVRDPDDGSILELDSVGPPLGIFEPRSYESNDLVLKQGSFVTLYTDGLPEARNIEGEEYGLERVKALIARHIDKPVSEITKEMIGVVERHTANSTYVRDDVAILNIRFL